jgi:hypothetical protein
MVTQRLARFVSVEANLHAVQVKRSGRNQNKATATLRAVGQAPDGLDGEL